MRWLCAQGGVQGRQVGTSLRAWARAALVGGAVACLFTTAAWAQTLFLDLNNAGSEIAVMQWHVDPAQRPAGQRGMVYERLARQNGLVGGAGGRANNADLYVVPSFERITPEARAAVMRAAVENERLILLAQDCAAPEPGKRPTGCDTVWDDLRRTELEREAATGHYGFEDLQRELEAVLAQVPQFDRLVVSGHHEGGYFRGELASVTREQWQSLFARIQRQAAAPFTLYALGCHTALPSVVRELFVPLLAHPRQTLIVGAEAYAPTRFEARNLSFMDEALTLQTTIHQQRADLRGFQQRLRRHRWPVALWLDGQYEAQDYAEAVPLPAAVAPDAAAMSQRD